ncbi:HesA/MoeB/ThiF family protein [Pectobacterium sp. CHL-2024]|uniref:HesA/MoeB/ThiF family protein n=1 Tax=Pectobacterium sp. CHL-2024 TaxID=3377079 RepID=UPI0037FCD635
MDKNNNITPAIQVGVDRLHEIFNNCFLIEVNAKNKNEVIRFELNLPADYLGVKRKLQIGFSENFPSVALALSIKPSPWLEWPHILDEFVCLFGGGDKAVYGDPVEVIDNTFYRLGKLISLVCESKNISEIKNEFDSEIISYWTIQATLSQQKLILLNRPRDSAPLYTLSNSGMVGGEEIWISDSESKILEHYQWQISLSKKKIDVAKGAFYLKLTSTPNVKFPIASGLVDWLSSHADGNHIKALKGWLEKDSNHPLRWVILEVFNSEPVSIIALLIKRKGVRDNQIFNFGLRSAKKKPLENPIGERDSLLITDTFLLDNEIIFSRSKDFNVEETAQKKVLLIGAGSLGSHVASQLIHSGITDLTIVDPDTLDDSNLGRHILTIDDLGKNKSLALKKYLKSCIPTAIITAIPKYFYQAISHKDINIYSYDCIVSTSADWPTEYFLWGMKSRIQDIAFVQAWVEPFAFVGHVLCSDKTKTADARHLFDKRGNFKNKFTYWENDGYYKLPACGVGYIPGSSLNIQQIAGMVSKSVINILEGNDRLGCNVWNSFITESRKVIVAGGKYVGPEIDENIESMVIKNEWNNE